MDSREIRELRKSLKLTQRDLANILDVEPVTISRWELGDRKPHRVHLRRMARLRKKKGG